MHVYATLRPFGFLHLYKRCSGSFDFASNFQWIWAVHIAAVTKRKVLELRCCFFSNNAIPKRTDMSILFLACSIFREHNLSAVRMRLLDAPASGYRRISKMQSRTAVTRVEFTAPFFKKLKLCSLKIAHADSSEKRFDLHSSKLNEENFPADKLEFPRPGDSPRVPFVLQRRRKGASSMYVCTGLHITTFCCSA